MRGHGFSLAAGEARVLDLRGGHRLTISNEGHLPAAVRIGRRGGGGWVPLDDVRLVPGTCWSRRVAEIGCDNLAVEVAAGAATKAVRVTLQGPGPTAPRLPPLPIYGPTPGITADKPSVGDETMPAYPAHQALKTEALVVYCSKKKVKSHEEGNLWVKACMEHFGLTKDDVRTIYTLDSCPDDAVVWP